MRTPTDSAITFPYGATTAPYSPSNPHAGVDYGGSTGDNVYAPHAGQVKAAGAMGECGQEIDIEGGKFKSRLCHNSQLLVTAGQNVSEGQVVARVGSTGATSGPHVHWVLWVNGNRVNPVDYLSEGEDMKVDQVTLDLIYDLGLHRPAGGDTGSAGWLGKEVVDVLRGIRLSEEHKQLRQKVIDAGSNVAQQKIDKIKEIVK